MLTLSDWLDAGEIEDDATLVDFMSIVGNKAVPAVYTRRFFRNVTAGNMVTVITASSCANSNAYVQYSFCLFR